MIGIGLIVWEAYDFYNTCQEEGLDAAVLKLGFSLAAMAVGAGVIKRGYKLGTFFVETAPEALALYKQAHPVFAKFYDVAAAAVAKGVQKVKEAATKFQAFDARLELRASEFLGKFTNKASGTNLSITEQASMMKNYIREMEQITGFAIPEQQRILLK